MNTENQQLPPEAIMTQMSLGCFVSQGISVAARLGLADLLKEAPQTISVLAEKTQTHERSLYRLLRALSSVGVFDETDPKVFGLTPLSETLLSDRPNNLRDAAIFMGASWHWQVYGEMLHSVQTGEAAWKQVHGAEVFPYLQQHPAEAEIFNRAMTSYSQAVSKPIAAAYDCKGIKTLVDVAGGHGKLLAEFLKANPDLNGVLFDLPEVIAGAGEVLEKEGVAKRVTTVGGDFFEAIPADADAYLMKHIIHDWDDDRAVKILKNIASVMNPNAKVLIAEQIIPAGNMPHLGKLMDLEMLVSPGGVERTEEEYREILAAAGLKLNRVIATKSQISIVEAIKAS